VTVGIEGWGTPESAWAGSGVLEGIPAVSAAELLGAATRLVVVAPHPDDEALAAAGLMLAAAAAGLAVLVVAASDGTASHPGSARWTPEALAVARPQETAQALERLGLGSSPVVRAGEPDGAVRSDALAGVLDRVVEPGDLLLVTWRGDGHPDHEAAGTAAAAVADRRGLPLLEAPVWTWHWAVPDDPRVPWERAVRLPLSPAAQEAKRRAVDAYRSQLEPDPALEVGAVLPPPHLERLLRPFEVYLR
jgi:LmbE family N-acetylglucosaminyl deacetylase